MSNVIQVDVRRTALDVWAFSVAGHQRRPARAANLATVEARLSKLFAGQDEDYEFVYRFRTGNAELDDLLAKIHEGRRMVNQLARWTTEALQHPVVAPMGTRQAAFLVRLSHQRIQQIRDTMREPVQAR